MRDAGASEGGAARDASGADGAGPDAGPDGAVDGGSEVPTVTLVPCWDVMGTGGDGEVTDVVEAAGIVYAGGNFEVDLTIEGTTVETSTERAGMLFALDATTGALHWLEAWEATDQTRVSTVDALPGGDLLVTFQTTGEGLDLGSGPLAAGLTVARLAGDTRAARWQRTFSASEHVGAAFGKIGANGWLLVAGAFNGQMPIDDEITLDAGSGTAGPDGYALALHPDTGAVQWATSFGSGGGYDGVEAAVLGDGDLFLTGSSRSDGSIDARLYVHRLDGLTGETVWRQRFTPTSGTGDREAYGTAIAWAPEGVVVAGPADADSDVGTGALAPASGESSFMGVYDPADGLALRASPLPSRQPYGALRTFLAPRDGALTVYDRGGFVTVTLDTLAPRSRWALPEMLGFLYAPSADQTDDRLYLAGRWGNVVGSLDPVVLCLELP